MKKSVLLLLVAGLVAISCSDKKPIEPPEQMPEEPVLTSSQAELTSLALSENHYNFGVVKKGEKVEHTYEVTNTGSTPLVISEVKPACGCTAPDFTKEPILPGEKGKITLAFDSTNFEGVVNKQASVYANVETMPIMLTFSAEVKS